ncbi:MAG TPA: DinB family protein [Phycisphaerales bacterium]|nr:DinB family protein [Phycisphaerales bacterium]
MSHWPWMERTFDFSFPVTKWPDIVERLRGTPVRLEEQLRGPPRDVLTRKLDGGWTIQENAGHLGDLEPLWMGRLEDFLAGKSDLRPADLTNERTFAAGHNSREIGDLLAQFRKLRGDHVARLEALTDDTWSRVAVHPRLRVPMRLVDACYFAAEHDDYHLARITRLMRLAGAEIRAKQDIAVRPAHPIGRV